jgi:hypothetical protein
LRAKPRGPDLQTIQDQFLGVGRMADDA